MTASRVCMRWVPRANGDSVRTSPPYATDALAGLAADDNDDDATVTAFHKRLTEQAMALPGAPCAMVCPGCAASLIEEGAAISYLFAPPTAGTALVGVECLPSWRYVKMLGMFCALMGLSCGKDSCVEATCRHLDRVTAALGGQGAATVTPVIRCQTCGKPSEKRCTRCKAVSYCNTECQRADWPTHKGVCPKPTQ